MSSLTLREYQEHAARTLPFPGEQKFFAPRSPNPDSFPEHNRNVDLLHGLLGLAGEVGELIDPVKKAMFYGKPLDVENVREEIGDLLWYIAGPLCRGLGVSLEDLAAANVVKLRARYEKGYSDTAAIARADKSQPVAPAGVCAQGFPTRPGYRWRSELSSDERAAIISKLRGTYEDGFVFDDDVRAWVAVEELWEPVTEKAHGEQIERELATADGPALELVLDTLRMGADSCTIPVECDGEHFVVTVERKPKTA